jgi:M6 family metalloprotease-like protein
MSSRARRTVTVPVLLVALGAVLGVRHSARADLAPVGTHDVLVLVCQYPNTTPVTSASRWAAELNDRVEAYYNQATGGRTHWRFWADVTSPIEFPFDYNGKEDDTFSVLHEGVTAIRTADHDQPNLFGDERNIRHVLVILNQKKRGRCGTFPVAVHFGLQKFGIAVISEPTNGTLTDREIALVTHELGHSIGLPDLYREKAEEKGLPHPVRFWCPMSSQNLQEFCGYTRRLAGWINDAPNGQMKTFAARLTPGTSRQTFTISPPQTGGDTELVLVPFSPAGNVQFPRTNGFAQPFHGYTIEARSFVGADLDGLPSDYQPGVLISHVRPRRPVPVEVIIPPGRDAGSQGATMALAAWTPDDPPFVDAERGITIRVVRDLTQAIPNGSFKVEVKRTTPARPDLTPTDMWLDSPHNDFDRYLTPTGADGAPALFGDSVFTPTTPVGIRAVTHRIHLKVVNYGALGATDVRGDLYILDPELPSAEDLFSEATLARLANGRVIRNIPFGEIGANRTAVAQVEYQPTGPFVAALVVRDASPPESGRLPEVDKLDNFRIEPFILLHVTFEGFGARSGVGVQAAPPPYAPIDLKLPISNQNEEEKLVYATAEELPAGWRVELGTLDDPERVDALLNPGQEAVFRLHATPPSSAQLKPGSLQEIRLTGWMDYGDSWIDAYVLPIYASFNYPARLALAVGKSGKGKVQVSAKLTYRNGTSATDRPIGSQRVLLMLAGSDGSLLIGGPDQPSLSESTNSSGTAAYSVRTKAGVQYRVIANFGGSDKYTPAASAPVDFTGR